MDTSILVSIVIPFYNVENYITNAISSVINQTYRNLEIILINDGSNDNSLDIVNEYAKSDNRIVVLSQEHMGQAIARNKGLDNCHGDYVIFADSDDWLEFNMVEKLLDEALASDADIVQCGYVSHGMFRSFEIIPSRKTIEGNKNIVKEYLQRRSGVLWNKIFSKKVIGSIRMPEIKVSEDVWFNYDVLCQCNKYVIIDEALYHHVARAGSVETTEFNSDFLDRIEVNRYIREQVARDYSEYFDLIKYNMADTIKSLMVKLVYSLNDAMINEYYLNFNRMLIKELRENNFNDEERFRKLKFIADHPSLHLHVLKLKARIRRCKTRVKQLLFGVKV